MLSDFKTSAENEGVSTTDMERVCTYFILTGIVYQVWTKSVCGTSTEYLGEG